MSWRPLYWERTCPNCEAEEFTMHKWINTSAVWFAVFCWCPWKRLSFIWNAPTITRSFVTLNFCECAIAFTRRNKNIFRIFWSTAWRPSLLPLLKTFSHWDIRIWNIKYSRTSMARTLIARLPRLFRTRSWVPWNRSHSCRFVII